MKIYGGVEVQTHSFLTLELDGSGRSASHPSLFNPGKDYLVHIEWETVWVPDPVWMFWVRDKSLAFARNWTMFLRQPVRGLVIILTMQNLKVQQLLIDVTDV